jgi:hypothetical protein
MVPVELALTTLAEVTATDLHQQHDSHGIEQLQTDTTEAGEVAGIARQAYEGKIGNKAVSPTNYKQLRQERQKELQPPLFGEE